MKRLLSIIAIISVVFIHNIDSNNIIFQDEMETTEVQDTLIDSSMEVEEVVEEMEEPEQLNFHQELKKRFIEGGPGFMGIVLLCLILGLAIAIERIIFLNLSESDSDKLTEDVEAALKSGGIKAAKEVCKNTPGPVASIFLARIGQS